MYYIGLIIGYYRTDPCIIIINLTSTCEPVNICKTEETQEQE